MCVSTVPSQQRERELEREKVRKVKREKKIVEEVYTYGSLSLTVIYFYEFRIFLR